MTLPRKESQTEGGRKRISDTAYKALAQKKFPITGLVSDLLENEIFPHLTFGDIERLLIAFKNPNLTGIKDAAQRLVRTHLWETLLPELRSANNIPNFSQSVPPLLHKLFWNSFCYTINLHETTKVQESLKALFHTIKSWDHGSFVNYEAVPPDFSEHQNFESYKRMQDIRSALSQGKIMLRRLKMQEIRNSDPQAPLPSAIEVNPAECLFILFDIAATNGLVCFLETIHETFLEQKKYPFVFLPCSPMVHESKINEHQVNFPLFPALREQLENLVVCAVQRAALAGQKEVLVYFFSVGPRASLEKVAIKAAILDFQPKILRWLIQESKEKENLLLHFDLTLSDEVIKASEENDGDRIKQLLPVINLNSLTPDGRKLIWRKIMNHAITHRRNLNRDIAYWLMKRAVGTEQEKKMLCTDIYRKNKGHTWISSDRLSLSALTVSLQDVDQL